MTDAESRAAPTTAALGFAGTIVAVEYLARHVLAPAFPVVADARVNDLVAAGISYVALSLLVARFVRAGGLGPALVGVIAAARRWEAWVGVAAVLALAAVLWAVDQTLWGRVTLPSFSLPPSSTTVLAGWRWLAPVSLVCVNCALIPVAEEWLWRGVVQPRFVRALGRSGGIAFAAVLFSLKHALVDASLGRLLNLTAFGVVLGVVASRTSWRASAVSHVALNSLFTVNVVIGAFLAPPPCLSPEPELSPELRSATTRALALIERPVPHETETLFTSDYLAAIPVEDFYRTVRTAYGPCSWKCTTRVDGPTLVQGQLACAHGSPYMGIGIETAPPNRVNYFEIKPRAQHLQ